MNFIRKSFKRQIFAVFLAVTLFLVIPGGLITVRTFQTRIKVDYEKKDIEQKSYVTDRISNMIDLANQAIVNVENNEHIIKTLSTGQKHSQDIYPELYEATKDIRSFSVTDLYINNVCSYSTGSGYDSVHMPIYYSALHEATSNNRTIYSFRSDSNSGNGAELMMVREILHDTVPCYVVVRIAQDAIEDQIKDGINAKDGFILANNYLRPLCLIGTAEDGIVLEEIRQNLLASNLYNYGLTDNIYMNELGDTNMLSIYITPPALEQSAVKAGYRTVMLLVVISVIVCFIVSSKLSDFFAKPINELYQAMKRFRKGDFDAKIELERDDEFEQLAVGFNKMTTQLKTTMEEQVKAERKVNETRLAMMQAQLNPHFLYNTLDTIKWVGKANQVPEIATLAASLAGILRSAISEGSFCKLSKELQMIRNYCDIQRIRFDDCFDLEISADEKLMDAIVPKLILQPLVENSIIHGLEGETNGHISVRVYVSESPDKDDTLQIYNMNNAGAKDETLFIEIKDNGKGITDEYIEALERDDIDTLEGHLGLNNVNTIIRMYYGKKYGIRASRLKVRGTIITVKLPLRYEIIET